jgi:DNA-binding NtrC family response regulator
MERGSMTTYEHARCVGDQDDTIRVLAVMRPGQGGELVRLLSHTRWTLEMVNTIADALRAMESSRASVILCEPKLPDGTWLNLLERAGEFSPAPQLLVLSETPENELWAEVLTRGGYDLLAQSLEAREVYEAIAGAWRHWKASADDSRTPRPERVEARSYPTN